MSRPTIDIKTGPFLFGDIHAVRYGPVWHVRQTYPLWYRMNCAILASWMNMWLPPRKDSDRPE